MIFLKSCPRCHGDMILDRDLYGLFLQCFQCGFMRDLAEKPAAFGAPQTARPRLRVVKAAHRRRPPVPV